MLQKVIVLLAAALICCSCNELNPGKPKPVTITWKQTGTWSGRGSTQTDSFEMGESQWRVKWKTSNETQPGRGHFVLTVNSAVSGRPLTEIVDHKGLGEGTVPVNDDPRLYYLVIDSNDVDWTVSVEQPMMTGGLSRQ